eukprot:g6637.t1
MPETGLDRAVVQSVSAFLISIPIGTWLCMLVLSYHGILIYTAEDNLTVAAPFVFWVMILTIFWNRQGKEPTVPKSFQEAREFVRSASNLSVSDEKSVSEIIGVPERGLWTCAPGYIGSAQTRCQLGNGTCEAVQVLSGCLRLEPCVRPEVHCSLNFSECPEPLPPGEDCMVSCKLSYNGFQRPEFEDEEDDMEYNMSNMSNVSNFSNGSAGRWTNGRSGTEDRMSGADVGRASRRVGKKDFDRAG